MLRNNCHPLVVIAILAPRSPARALRGGAYPADHWDSAIIGRVDGRRAATAIGAVIGYQLAADNANGLTRQYRRRLERRRGEAIPAA